MMPHDRKSLPRWIGLAVLVGSSWIASSATAQRFEVDDELRVVAALRQRRLFDLAETLCRDRLADRELNPTEQVELATEWIRTLAARAVVAGGDERAAIWEQADQVADQFLVDHPEHPRKILISVQRALTHQMRGRLLVQEHQAEMVGDPAVPEALAALRQSNRMLKQIESDIDRMIPDQRRRRLDSHELTAEQLLNLKRNLAFQMAINEMTKARLYAPDDRLNRIDTLNEVLRRLEGVLSQATSEQPLWWDAQLARARALILLGDFERAKQVLDGLPEQVIDQRRHAARLETLVEWAIAAGQPEQAIPWMNSALAHSDPPATLALALLRLRMALAKSRPTESERQRWRSTATDWMRKIESQYGPYWGRRAELTLIGSAGSDPDSTGSGDLDLLIRMGDQALRRGRVDDARRAYEKAADQARKDRKGAARWVALVRLSQLWEREKNPLAAGQTLIDAATDDPRQPTAPAVHLRGCWNLGQVEPRTAESIERWVAALGDHLNRWPQDPTSNQARRWLGQHRIQEKQWTAAVETLIAISPDDPNWMTIGPWIMYAWQRQTQDDPDRNDLALAKRLLESIDQQLRRVKTDSGGDAAGMLHLLKTQIGLTVKTIAPADALIEIDSVIAGTDDQQTEMRTWARLWQIVAQAAGGQTEEAIERLENQMPTDVIWMDRLARALESTLASELWHEIGPIRVRIATRALANAEITDAKRYWQPFLAAALLDTGQADEAVRLLSELVQAQPKRLAVLQQYARALSQVRPDDIQTVQQWRRIAAQVKPHTEPWYEARLETARALVARGERGQARSLLEYMKAVPPGWAGSRYRVDFEALLKELKDDAPPEPRPIPPGRRPPESQSDASI